MRTRAAERLDAIFDRLEAELEGPYVLGERVSVADHYLFMLVRWGRRLPRPAWERPRLAAHWLRMAERPAVARVLADEGLEGRPPAASPVDRTSHAHNHAVPCMTVQDRAGNGLLGVERRQAILDALARDGKVVAARLVDELGVSEDTIRRDLRELAAQGLVQRVHGGALAPAPRAGSFARRRETGTEAKVALAEAAVGLLARAQVILLDGSTTNLEVARRLPPDRPCTVLTNSPPIAAALADHPSAEVIVIGGRLDKASQVTLGAAAVDFIRGVRADACVLGICALHPEQGVTTNDLEEARRQAGDGGRGRRRHRDRDLRQAQRRQRLRRGRRRRADPSRGPATAGDELLDPYRALGVTVTRHERPPRA